MTENSAVSAAIGDEESDSAIPDGVTSMMEALAPSVAKQFGSSNFATVAGGVSLFRAFRSYRKGDRKRALLRAVVGLFWVGVVLAKRRKGSGSGPGLSEVASTGPDVDEAVEPDERETDHATGSEVVNTTDADIEESDTAPELDSDASEADVDQRDVAGTDEIGDADEASENGSDESQAGGESEMDSDETGGDAGRESAE